MQLCGICQQVLHLILIQSPKPQGHNSLFFPLRKESSTSCDIGRCARRVLFLLRNASRMSGRVHLGRWSSVLSYYRSSFGLWRIDHGVCETIELSFAVMIGLAAVARGWNESRAYVIAIFAQELEVLVGTMFLEKYFSLKLFLEVFAPFFLACPEACWTMLLVHMVSQLHNLSWFPKDIKESVTRRLPTSPLIVGV
jgi:hypothetical protein